MVCRACMDTQTGAIIIRVIITSAKAAPRQLIPPGVAELKVVGDELINKTCFYSEKLNSYKHINFVGQVTPGSATCSASVFPFPTLPENCMQIHS